MGGFLRRGGRWEFQQVSLADVKQIDADRLGDVLKLPRAEIADREFEPPLHLPIGLLGKTDIAGRGDALKPRSDIDAVAHQVAVGFLDDVAQMYAHSEFDATIGWHARIAFDHCVLHFDRAANRVDDAPELDDAAVTGAFHHAATVGGDGRVDQIAAKPAQVRERALLVGADEPAIADDIGNQDRRELAGRAHWTKPPKED